MKSKTISHSKYKNPGVLFELLVRQITADTLAGVQTSPALNILKKYFNVGTELGKEVQLYRAFFDGKTLSETKAIHFIDLILTQRRKLNEKLLAREKYDLIREIKSQYDLKEFLNCKIPAYTIHASIYKTFLNETKDENTQIVNVADVATAKFTLVEHLMGTTQKKVAALPHREAEILSELKQESEEVRLLAYKYLVDRFNNKYANLSDKQKNLLREYINNVPSSNSLGMYVRNEVPQLYKAFVANTEEVTDQVLRIKLNEVATQLRGIGEKKVIREGDIAALMIAYELLKEIEE